MSFCNYRVLVYQGLIHLVLVDMRILRRHTFVMLQIGELALGLGSGDLRSDHGSGEDSNNPSTSREGVYLLGSCQRAR